MTEQELQEQEELDFRQNVAIALLAVMAVLLFSRTELFRLGWETLGDAVFTAEAAEEQPEAAEDGLTVPLRFAATGVYGGVYGRYVIVNMTSRGRSFRAVRRLFGDALSAPLPFEEIGRDDFLSALRGTSLYCDFLTPLPLSFLAGLTGAELSDERPARSLALARGRDGVKLCLWDGGETYLRRAAPITRRELDELASRYELGSGSFAADLSDAGGAYGNVAPLSLFPSELPSLPVYSASGGLTDIDLLMTAFLFNPLTKSRYTEANGTEVIMDGVRSVRFRANGSIYYQGGGGADLSIEGAGEIPTGWEAAAGCAALLNEILVPQGCAAVYPREIRREGGATVVRFGCALDNVPVFYADGGFAAVVTLDGKKIASAEIRPRRYAATDTDSMLLPLPQALGLAGLYPGAELSLGYQDAGGERLHAQWFASFGAGADAEASGGAEI